MNKKRVIFVQNIDFPQQGAIDIFYYAKYLSKRGVSVTCIVASIEDDISSENLEIVELGNVGYLEFIVKAYRRICKMKKGALVDYVYFFAQHPLSVLLQAGVRYILGLGTVYDVVSGPIGSGFLSIVSKYTIKLGVLLSDKYVALDKGIIKKLNLPQKKEHTIVPMGYDKGIFLPKTKQDLFGRGSNDLIFAYIGTLSNERSLGVFVRGFCEAIECKKNIKLYFIGSGDGEEELKKIAGEQLGRAIFFLGKKEHKMIPDYINSADVLVSYVPKIDCFEYQPPTKLIEYLGCGKPVLATNTIAQEEILREHTNLIHEDNKESVRKKIIYCVENIKDIEKGRYEEIVSEYAREKLVEKIDRLL